MSSLSSEIGRRFSESELRLSSPISQIPPSPLSPSTNIFDLKEEVSALLETKEFDAAFTKVVYFDWFNYNIKVTSRCSQRAT
jgi:hypothetical protein